MYAHLKWEKGNLGLVHTFFYNLKFLNIKKIINEENTLNIPSPIYRRIKNQTALKSTFNTSKDNNDLLNAKNSVFIYQLQSFKLIHENIFPPL